MNVRVNGVYYRTKTGTLEIKRRFGAAAVLVSSEEPRPVIAAVDAMGHFLVQDGQSYNAYSLQTGAPHVMAVLASQREMKLSQRDEGLSQMVDGQKRARSSSRSSATVRRRKGNYVFFVQSFMKGFTNVSFADAAKEWRLFPEDVKRTASVEVLLERVRSKGLYQSSFV
ncbi:hypothetical protein LSM04_008981 [Trypanosoma melophagium]|uniref:uncharacterized protein n=1 Tax=Trypanosoma melophagium TaxID=715481 RepID=UPI00351A8571|nr:hypothetical protein LSM04_008981 [Trypanosoma melophagium]